MVSEDRSFLHDIVIRFNTYICVYHFYLCLLNSGSTVCSLADWFSCQYGDERHFLLEINWTVGRPKPLNNTHAFPFHFYHFCSSLNVKLITNWLRILDRSRMHLHVEAYCEKIQKLNVFYRWCHSFQFFTVEQIRKNSFRFTKYKN